MSTIPEMSGMPQVIFKETDPVENPIAAGDRLALCDVRLSKNAKLRMAHKGVTEVAQTWKTAPTYEFNSSTSVYEYSAAEARPRLGIAETDDGLVYTNNGTFVDGIYQNNASSTSSNDGLVGPDVLALASDAEATIIDDMPGKTGGEAMTSDNYLSLPGRPVSVASTFQSALDDIITIVDTDTEANLTIQKLIDCGIPVFSLKTSKLAAYKVAFGNAAHGSVTTVDDVYQIVVTVNNA